MTDELDEEEEEEVPSAKNLTQLMKDAIKKQVGNRLKLYENLAISTKLELIKKDIEELEINIKENQNKEIQTNSNIRRLNEIKEGLKHHKMTQKQIVLILILIEAEASEVHGQVGHFKELVSKNDQLDKDLSALII